MLSIELPWPPRKLHPNARVHWAEKSKLTKSTRLTAYYLTMVAARERPASSFKDRVQIRLTFYPPVKRARDHDGLVSSCKAYLDGVADALGINDTRFALGPLQVLEPVKGGKVVFEIE